MKTRALFLLLSLGCAIPAVPTAADAPRPNLVVLLADDMGYSDLGCYGGEIATPNLDRLAANGLRFTQFYNGARCCPTRAALLTGLHPHQAGIGHMTSEDERQGCDEGVDGYRGILSPATVTIEEALRGAGYRTLMCGKWHVGTFEGSWPTDRGFDRYYGIVRGAANHWRPGPEKLLMQDDVPIEPPADFYSSDSFTDHAIEHVREAEASDEQPFFLYLAFTAPHWPLHAPAEDVARYRGRYLDGWDAVRVRRLERMRELGIVDERWELSPRDAPEWSRLSKERREELDYRMAIYAAMVDRLDQNVGRLVATLEELGELENTLILFLADNGGCAEGGDFGGGGKELLGTRQGYFLTYGKGWANASNTPFRRFKHWTHEGGIATPLIAHWPAGIDSRGELCHEPGQLVDLMPTLLELAGAEYPEERAGLAVPPKAGVSLAPLFRGETLPERPLFWEHEGNGAVRIGRWKLVAVSGGDWELYDVEADRTETHDLALEKPELARGLFALYDAWTRRCGVLPWPLRRPPGYAPPPREYPATWEDLAKAKGDEDDE